MSDDLITATFGLVGVLIGGLISTWTSWELHRRQEKVSRDREQRAEQIELRRAARLLDEEFVLAVTFTEFARDKKRWWVQDPALGIEQWHASRAVFATQLTKEQWIRVSQGANAVQHLMGLRDEMPLPTQSDTLPEEALQFVSKLEGSVRTARKTLENFT